jgi:hypothetical protein
MRLSTHEPHVQIGRLGIPFHSTALELNDLSSQPINFREIRSRHGAQVCKFCHNLGVGVAIAQYLQRLGLSNRLTRINWKRDMLTI